MEEKRNLEKIGYPDRYKKTIRYYEKYSLRAERARVKRRLNEMTKQTSFYDCDIYSKSSTKKFTPWDVI
jgi:hypothetical protein